ncbi:MAG: hypothetical protein KC442_13480 [Thermomicrobiales bacterium]|nr:hypothetical protein [Thermomicrobiales bacterium]
MGAVWRPGPGAWGRVDAVEGDESVPHTVIVVLPGVDDVRVKDWSNSSGATIDLRYKAKDTGIFLRAEVVA